VGPVEVGSLRDLPEKGPGYDLILSTVEVGRQAPRDDNLLVVSPFLSDGDIVRIGERIRSVRGRPGRAETGPPAAAGGAEEALVRGMAEGLWLRTVPAGPFEAVVGGIAAALCDGGVARDRREIGRLILKREKMGSIVIPHSHVSLLHIRSDLVSRPFVGVFRMDGSVLMESAGFVQEPVDTFLVLLARENESPAVLEKMGNISVALIEDAKFPSMLRQSRLDGLRALLKDLLGLRR
jgi:mannitol operon transcriptional antiterminator